MLTRKGNLICKALVFALVVITVMTLDGCCDDCLGGSKGNKSFNPSLFGEPNQIINTNLNNNNGRPPRTKKEIIEAGFKESKDKDKETAGFKKTKDGNLWIFGTTLFYSAKNGKFYSVKNGDLCVEEGGKVEEGEKKDNCNIFEDILIKYLKGFNSNYKNIEINNIKVENDDLENFDTLIKVVFIGNEGVGKSQICRVGTGNVFESDYTSTVGFENFTRTTNIDNGKIFKLHIWDICGQVKVYRSLVSGFIRNASIIILGCDVTNGKSFKEGFDDWYVFTKGTAPEGAAIFVVGNKCDLINEKKEIEPDAVDKWIKDKCEQK